MPTKERVREFVETVERGEHIKAIADYYHVDASMQEPDKPARVGREVLIEYERAVLARVASMHTHPTKFILVDGDSVVINWVFDAVDMDGTRRRLEELTLQKWRGDRISTERFFYDTASAWRVVPA